VSALGHIASVVALWTMMLFGLRFAAAASAWLLPLARAVGRFLRCTQAERHPCLRRIRLVVDQLHLDLNRAITTPWSATLLFAGSTLIGLGYFVGSLGDAIRLVSNAPESWATFDIVTDCLAAGAAVTGMAFVQAATSQRRTASFLVSGVLILTGTGIAVVTL
jgi:hypothetical protein